MADSKITALTALTAADPANDMIPIVDVSDTPPASGNTKRISINNLLACSPSATLASATITGALTVDTTTLVVNPSGYADRVGIGTATPAAELHVVGGANFSDGTTTLRAVSSGNVAFLGTITTDPLVLRVNNIEQYRIAQLGVFTWSDGAGGTRMTLNSTGLGVGASPSSGGSISNASYVLGGIFSTLNGILSSVATATPTTIFAAPSDSILMVTASVNGAAPSDYKVVAVVKRGGAAVAITTISSATSVTITSSGTDIQATQTSGGNQNIYFNVLRLA